LDCWDNWHNRCLTFVDINYIVIWARHNAGGYYVRIPIMLGPAISQVQTTMVAKIWNQKRYVGTNTINITPTCWNQIRGTFSSYSGRTVATSLQPSNYWP